MKIFAIGMNYTEHNKSLHGTLSKPERPVIFTKADSALLNNGKPFFIPDHLGRIEYETEVVVRISKLGKTIPQRFAHRYYDAVTVGIDFTAREMQKKLREAGQPWELAKGFDGSAVIGEWVDIQKFRDIQALHFRLDLNDKTVQEGCTSDMLDASLFRTFYFGRSRLTAGLMLRNLTGDRTLYAVYESNRLRRIPAGDAVFYEPHASRCSHAWPRSFYVTVSYRF